jgi:hypothetical protein
MPTFRNTSIFTGKVNNYLPSCLWRWNIVCSETSEYNIQTPGNYREENIQHTEHGDSLKSRILLVAFTIRGRSIWDIVHKDDVSIVIDILLFCWRTIGRHVAATFLVLNAEPFVLQNVQPLFPLVSLLNENRSLLPSHVLFLISLLWSGVVPYL